MELWDRDAASKRLRRLLVHMDWFAAVGALVDGTGTLAIIGRFLRLSCIVLVYHPLLHSMPP